MPEEYYSGMNSFFYAKNKILLLLTCACGIFMIIFPKDVSVVTKEAIVLWLNSIVPALFPFFIVSGIIRKSGLLQVISYRILPVIMGFFSGYPVGAQVAADYLKTGLINKDDFYHIVSYSMVTGPAFLIGSCGIGFFSSQRIGYYFAVSHYFAAFLIWAVYGRKTKVKITKQKNLLKVKAEKNILKSSLTASIDSIFMVLGYLIIFMMLLCMIRKTSVFEIINNEYFTALITGVMEMTIGAKEAAALENKLLAAAVTSFIISFGGLCVIGQTVTMLEGIDISIFKLIFFKILHGLISGFLCLLMMILW